MLKMGERPVGTNIKKLAILNVLQMPSLLLHELGSKTSLINQKQDKYVTDLFSFDFHMCHDVCRQIQYFTSY